MLEIIRPALVEARTLDEVKTGVLSVLSDFRNKGFSQIGYVSGIISSDGPAKISQNLLRLAEHTKNISYSNTFPVFSPTCVFDDNLFKRIGAENLSGEDFMVFWRAILRDKHRYVTDIFMTPRWEYSEGATEEHQIAKELKLNIYYVKDIQTRL